MSIFKSIATAFRGHANNIGEAVVDANADTILTQQVKDVETEIKNSKLKIAELKAKAKGVKREVDELVAKKEQGVAKARALLEQDKQAEAEKFIAAIEREITPKLAPKQKQLSMMEASLVKLEKGLAQAEKNKIDFETRVEITKTQKQVNKMTEEANASTINSASASSQMKATLERFEAKNQQRSDMLDSLDEMENNTDSNSLDSLLAEDTTSSMSLEDRLKNL